MNQPILVWADTESARTLRNALHYYQFGQYDKSKGFFLELQSIGTAKEKATARHYLATPALRQASPRSAARAAPVARPASPPSNTGSLLEEPEQAPERQEPQMQEAEEE